MGLDTPVFQAYRGSEPPRFASPAELEPIVREYARTRPASKFDRLAANPAG